MLRRPSLALLSSGLFLVAGLALSLHQALAHDREHGDRSSRLTPPDGAPAPEARGEVELGKEALVVEVEGLPAGDYKVCLDDGTGTLAPIGTITVAAEDDEEEEDDDGEGEGEHEDDDDGEEGEGASGDDGDGDHDGDGDNDGDGHDDDDDHEGDDDDDDHETEGRLRLGLDALPFGATSPLELGGRAIAVKGADDAVVLQGKTPAPIVEEPEEKEGICPLARPDGGVDADAAGVVKLESGDGRIVIKVKLENVEAGKIYSIVFVNPADGAAETIGMATGTDEGHARFKLDTHNGDALPFGAGDLAALEGFRVEVKDPDGGLILTGTICAAKVDDDEDGEHDEDDGDDHEGDDGDDDGEEDPPGADEPCEANLSRPDPAPDADAEGEVEIEGGELEVEIEHLAEGTAYDVLLIEPGEGGASANIGKVTAGEEGHGELEFEASAETPLPFGKTDVAELVGFGVEVRDPEGNVVLSGKLPDSVCEAEEEDRHEGDDDEEDDHEDGEHDGEGHDGEDGEHEDGEGDDEPPPPPAEEGAGGLAPAADDPRFTLVGKFDAPFFRGDASHDGLVDIADPINVLSFLFSGGTRPYCLDAADANDDGALNISDPIHLLSYLFLGGVRPAAPGTMIPGSDPTADGLYCEEAPAQ